MPQRIVSLLPSATEIVFALGLGDRLVGRTHECDFPPEAASVPVVTRSLLPADASSAEIDALVSAGRHEHRSLYQLDRAALEAARPDLILTQELCDVCAVRYEDVVSTVGALAGVRLALDAERAAAPAILSLEPGTLAEVVGQLRLVGAATGAAERAEALARALEARLDALRAATADLAVRPRVLCLEWLEPLYVAGHWVPEQVELAGGVDLGGRRGRPSVRIGWETVRALQPEALVLLPCGFDLGRTVAEAAALRRRPGWDELPAVRAGRVWAVNANAYFSRPGPRVVAGAELLASLLHPERFAGRFGFGPEDALALT